MTLVMSEKQLEHDTTFIWKCVQFERPKNISILKISLFQK